MSGVSWWDAELSAEQRLTVAADLGRQLRRVHALRPSGVATDADWPNLNVLPPYASKLRIRGHKREMHIRQVPSDHEPKKKKILHGIRLSEIRRW